MKKIPSLFQREGDSLTSDFHPLAAWVVAGEGVATRKWDGTAVRWFGGRLWARFDAKGGKPTPPDFVPCQAPDPITYHHPGWVPAVRPEDKWIREAAANSGALVDGCTYEACGPKIGGNPEHLDTHVLLPHGAVVCVGVPRTFGTLREYFERSDIEGVVWWRDLADVDCDKVKITGAALGIRRGHR